MIFWDFQLAIKRLYGMIQSQAGQEKTLLLGSMVLDENSKIVGLSR